MTAICRRISTVTSVLIAAILVAVSSAAGTENQPVIKFAFQDRVGSVLPIVAVKKGFFSAEGLKIKALRFSSGPACAEALYSGAADIGAMGDTTAIILTARSPEFVILASHAAGEHRHRIMVRKNANLQTLTDLKGKRLGVKKGTSTYGGLLAALTQAGIGSGEIDIIDLTPPIMTDALLAGSLDAFAASEPTPSVAEQKGARELMTLGRLGNEYPLLILARRKMLRHRQSAVDRFVRALKRAEQFVAGHPEETVEIMAAETGLSPDTTRRAMERHVYRLRWDDSILSSLERTALFLKKQQVIPKLPELSRK